jgi:acyl carrier protein
MIEKKVIEIISQILKYKDVNLNSSRGNIENWDSLKHIEIIFSIEDELHIEFPEESLKNLNDVRSIINLSKTLHEA